MHFRSNWIGFSPWSRRAGMRVTGFQAGGERRRWWRARRPKAPAGLLAGSCDLRSEKASDEEDIIHPAPESLAVGVHEKEQRLAKIMGRIRKLLEKTEGTG